MDSPTPNERVDALLSLRKTEASVPNCKLTKVTGFKLCAITFESLIKPKSTYTSVKNSKPKATKVCIYCIEIFASFEVIEVLILKKENHSIM